eukprot:TRINITY_DN934_c0_g1_i4.p1 TRINITY_DN934_c0_g1~~TRINITY_DN934_c0_g1_i4.p1  ORF type:complete len:3509 (+),score=786.17 TRINITY_DN934_c0_g1_i4:1199-10528(+)
MAVHVRHNLTDEPITGATVRVLIVETGELATPDPLVTDETGTVTAPIPMDAEYEIVVIHEDFINQERMEPVDCDELHCELCAPVVSFELHPNPDPPICIENGGFIIVSISDELTDQPIHLARIDYKLLKNNHTRLEDLVLGTDVPTNRNGTTKLRVPTSGMYEVDIHHGNYEATEIQMVNVTCSEDPAEECSCEWPLEHIMTQDFCDDSFLNVVIRDSITNQAIPGVSVNVTLAATSTHLLEDEETDQFGAVKALIEGSAVYLIHVAKEGFTSEEQDTFIFCAPDACDECSQTLTITMNPEPGCDVDMFAEITVTDSIDQNPIENVTVTITLIEFANGPSDENVGGVLVTDENGEIRPQLFVDGNYTVTLTSPDHLTVERGFELNTYELCENPILPLQMVPIVPPMCEPVVNITVRDNSTLLPIPLASLNLTLLLQEEIAGSSVELVGENLLTDENGMVFYLSLAYGNLTGTVTAEGYHPNSGTLEIICDGFNCAECELALVVELEEIHCPVSEVTITIVDELTQEPIPDAVVTYTLTSTPETGSTFITFPPNTTNDDGVVTFPLVHMGNYTITVEKDGYDPVETPTDLECNPEHCEACLPVFTVPIRKEYCENVNLALWVANGVTNGPLTGAAVDVVVEGFEGQLQPVGRVIVDEEGWARIPIIGDGEYFYDITYPGFAPTQESQNVNLQELMSGAEPNCDLFSLVMMGAKPVFPPLECGDAETEGVRVTLAWAEEPADLDLYSYKVSRTNPQDTCLAYYCDQKELCGCMEFTNDVTTGGLNGTESISYCCNEPEVYMIYVDDESTEGRTMGTSEARILITEPTGTQEIIRVNPTNVPSGTDARYWLAGCMVIEETVPRFTRVDQYFAQDPKVVDPLFCYNLIKSMEPIEDPVYVTVTVTDAITSRPIAGAVVKLSLTENETPRVYEEVSSEDGVALAILDAPGSYEVFVEADGYIPDRDTLTVLCAEDGLMVCIVDFSISLLPETSPGTIELTLDWVGEPGPKDMDLFTYQVAKEDTSRTCKTFFGNRNGCDGVTGSENSQDGALGGESVLLEDVAAHSGFTFMIYGKKSGDNDIFESGARVTVSNGNQASTTELDTALSAANPGAVYWIAGCLEIVGQGYNFIPVNKFYQSNPVSDGNPNKLYCHNLIQNGAASTTTPAPFCDAADIKISVRDAVSFVPVSAMVSVSLINTDRIFVLAEQQLADGNGLTAVPIQSNGRYELKVSAAGYITDSDVIEVNCNINDCSSCGHEVYVSLSPMVDEGAARIMLGWGEMPNNWDLRSLQVKIADPTSTCVTSSEESCAGSVGPVDQVDSYGAETLDVSNSEYTYLVYVKNSCGVPYSTVSASHVTITDGYDTQKSYLPVQYYNHETFWIIGCLRFKREGYVYREINEFLSEDPSEEGNLMKMYCHNTVGQEDVDPTTTPSPPQPAYVQVLIRDPSTSQAVAGAAVTVTMTSDEYNYTVESTTNDDGFASIPVYRNGYYEITADEPSHFETQDSFFVECYGEPLCSPGITFSLIPAVVNAGDVRLIGEWNPSLEYIAMDIFQISAVGEGCTTGSACSSVNIESPDNSTVAGDGVVSMIIPGSQENDGTSFLIYQENTESSGRDFPHSHSSVVVVDSDSATRVQIPNTRMSYNTVREALLFGGWRTKGAVEEMSEEDRRNTLIVELEKITSYTIAQLQGIQSNGNLGSLVGIAAIAVFLESRSIRTVPELFTMTYDDQRNTLISDLNENGGFSVSYLQGLGDFDLAVQGFEVQFYNRRDIRAASFGQSFWIIGCMNVVSGVKRFELVNRFTNQLPEQENRLFCHDLLDLPAPVTRGPPSFWDGKFLNVVTRNAIDNTETEVCVDVLFTEDSAETGLRVATILLEDECGASVLVPLSDTGSGLYSVQFSAAGFVGFSEDVQLDEASCGTGPNCMFYTTVSPTPAAGNTRAILSWDDSVEGVDFSVYQIDSNLPVSQPGCLLDSTSSVSCGQSMTRNVANILDGSLGGTAYTAAGSEDYSYMLFSNIPDASSLAVMTDASLEQALLFGRWRTESQLLEMSVNDMRNTLIVELNRISSLSIPELQALSSTGDLGSLVGFASISVYLLSRNIRTSADLSTMDYDDQRNTLISTLVNNGGYSTRELQGLNDFALASAGFGSNIVIDSNLESLRFTATNGVTTEERRIPASATGGFWVIGCLKAYADSYTFVAADLFTSVNPTVENGRYCHNLFMDSVATTFPEDVYIEATVRSAMDNSPVMGATVQTHMSSESGITSGITDGNGIARIPVYNNGTYEVYVNGDGYENGVDQVIVSCSDSNCSPQISLSVAPELDDSSAMITLNWGRRVRTMNLRSIQVDASSSDAFCSTDEQTSAGRCANVEYVQNTIGRGEGGLDGGDAILINNLDASDVLSYMIMVNARDARVTSPADARNNMKKSRSVVTFMTANSARKVGMNRKLEFEYSLRGVLIFGEWTTISEIFTATEEEQRNTLIVSLESWSSLSISELQGMSNEELIEFGSITAFLKAFSINRRSALRQMNIEEQTNSILNTLSRNSEILSSYRLYQANWYLGSADLRNYFNQMSRFAMVSNFASNFKLNLDEAVHMYWIAGCIEARGGDVKWVPVGEFVEASFDRFFCHKLLYGDLPEPTTTTTEAPFYENIGIKIIARNSQTNAALSGARGSVSLQTTDGLIIVADDLQFGSDGTLFVPVSSNGRFSINVKADGFINSDFEMVVACTSADCPNEKLVTMSPVMPPGQTRIMITWETASPTDVDTHVMAVRKSDSQTCKTYYSNKNGCASVSQDLDNTSGGLNGAETVTLLDNAINSGYRYLVGIHDYNFQDNGVPFLNSGSSMTVTNGVQTVTKRMEGAGPITSTDGFVFFGCIDVQVNGEYTFTPAPAGTFFNGQDTAQWLTMMAEHCREEIEVPTTEAPTQRPHTSAATAAPTGACNGAERADTVEISPGVQNPQWGNWGEAQYCAAGAFARSVRVKVEPFQGDGEADDTGVNGIEFLCSDGCVMTSTMGSYGEFAANKTCPGTIENGFVDKLQFKSSEGFGTGLGENDNTGIDGLRWCCSAGWGWTQTINGYKGSLGEVASCPAGTAIYGFQAKLQDIGPDKKGMTNAKFFCAPF